MARNYVRIIVHNDSNAILILRTKWTSGEWTSGWNPPLNKPNEGLHWQAEGESVMGIPLTGVEARVSYDIIDSSKKKVGELYIYADIPWELTPEGDIFHVRATSEYYAAYSETKVQKFSNHTVLEISFRNTKQVKVANFKPSINGFQFSNNWSGDLPVVTLGSLWNRFLKGLPSPLDDLLGISKRSEGWMPITNSSGGLCGGMCYTIMDYFNSKELPPLPNNFSADGTPIAPNSAIDPLFLFIRDRLIDSFDTAGRGSRWLSYSSPIYPDGDEGITQLFGLVTGKARISYREEWPSIREQLDSGKLATIGLVQTDELVIGDNHQVVAYAYEQSGQVVKLWVYDPNYPNLDSLYLQFDTTLTSERIKVDRYNYPLRKDGKEHKAIFAILYMNNYTHKKAPQGRDIPPPARKKIFRLVETNAKSSTTEGTISTESKNQCGGPYRVGKWKCKTTVTYLAEISGYIEPQLKWSINNIEVPYGTEAIYINNGAKRYKLSTTILPGNRSLRITSSSGDTYTATIKVEMIDKLGEKKQDQLIFDVDGAYEGPKLEDIAAAAQCLKKLIPYPLKDWTIPKPNIDPKVKFDIDKWHRETISNLDIDKSLTKGVHKLVKDYINFQHQNPELSIDTPTRVNRKFTKTHQR